MKRITYYEVTCNFDNITHVANFENLEDAEKFSHGNAYYRISSPKEFVVCEDQWEGVEYKKSAERQRILSKLTRSERITLGLE